jgi:hypothetical protein
MFPTVPDKSYKIFIAIGIVAIGFAIFSLVSLDQGRWGKRERLFAVSDSLDLRRLYFENVKKDASFQIGGISRKNELINPLEETDSSYSYTNIVSSDPRKEEAYRRIDRYYEIYDNAELQIKLATKRYHLAKENHELESQYDDQLREVYYTLLAVGAICFFFGILGMLFDEIETRPRCQSCGKLFSGVVRRSILEQPGSVTCFCTGCYDGDSFVNPDLTLEQVISDAELERRNWLNRLAMKRRLKSLDRWKLDRYD